MDWKTYVLNIGTAWVLSIATYYGLFKPAGTTLAPAR